ncbi:MAG: 2TM domain-containing protein [Dehalococcoidales bacterium]
MANQMSEEQVYEEARKRVEAKKGFYKHLVVYVVVNIMLVLIWAFAAGGGHPWFLWVLGFWGLGVLFNFFDVFVWPRKSDKSAIEKEAEKIRREQG